MPNFLANRAFITVNEMKNFLVDDTDEDMLGPFILPKNSDDYMIIVWRRYSTADINNETVYPANGPGRWIALATTSSQPPDNNTPEMIQFSTLAEFKAYTTPSSNVLYCISEAGKAPVLFVWNATSTATEITPLIVKLTDIVTGRMFIASESVVSSTQPTGTPPMSGITYLWKQNDAVNTYDSVIEYISTATEWLIKSSRTRKHTASPDTVMVSPNFDGEFFVDTTTATLYVGLIGGWTSVTGASS